MREQTRARGGSFTRDLHRGGLAARLLSPAELRAAPRAHRAPRRGPAGAGARRRHDARLGGRRRRQRGLALDVDRLGLRRDRPGHRHLPQQHARRVRPRRRQGRCAGPAADEHDGAVDRARPRRRGRGSSSAAPARRGCAARSCRSSSTSSSTGSPSTRRSPRRASTSTSRTSTARAGSTAAELDRLEALGYDVVRWRRRNLFFGGAAAVEFEQDGALAAAGDPRRGGAGVVV